MEDIRESDLCLDIEGKKILPGSRIICIEPYHNKIYKGTVRNYTAASIMIILDGASWIRQVRRWNSERMIYVLPEEKKK